MAGWYELGIFVAWHAALFQRAKTLPALEPLLEKMRDSARPAPERKRPQTWQEMKARLKEITGATTKPAPKRIRKKA